MTDNAPEPSSTPDLRPILGRLEEIARKCESMGSRNRELPDMAVRVREVVNRLRSPTNGESDYRALARHLFPVARLFESLGFHSVAREVAHVERSLEALAPAAPTEPRREREPQRRTETTCQAPDPALEGTPAADPENEIAMRSRRLPPTVVLAIVAVIVTFAVCGVVILSHDPSPGRLTGTAQPALAVATPHTSPTATVSATAATPSTAIRGPELGRKHVLDAVSAARRALQSGDPAGSVEALNDAARVDPNAGLVLEVAAEIARHHLAQAEVALEHSSWDEAESEIALAAALTRRFNLDRRDLDAVERRLEGLVRYRQVDPRDLGALREAVAMRVEVVRIDGALHHGVLAAVDGGNLVLRTDRTMGGGSILFSERIPLDTIRLVKVYPQ